MYIHSFSRDEKEVDLSELFLSVVVA